MKKLIMLALAMAGALTAVAMPAGFTTDFDAALKRAAAEKRPVLALFTGSDWCPWCVRLEQEVLAQKAFASAASKEFVLAYLDFPQDTSRLTPAQQARNRALAQKYAVRGYPTVLLLDADGKVLAKTGYRPGGPDAYLAHLRALVPNAR